MKSPYWANIICTNLQDALPLSRYLDPDGPGNFAGIAVVKDGVPALAVSCPVTAAGYEVLSELGTSGPYPLAEASGIPAQQVKACTLVQVSDRSIETGLVDWYTQNGYSRQAND